MSSKKEQISGAQELTESITQEVDAPATEAPKRTQLIYCGPNLQKGVLAQYTVYRGDGPPKHLDQHIANCPAIRRLFVAPDELNETVQAISTTGTPHNIWFKEVQSYVQGGAN